VGLRQKARDPSVVSGHTCGRLGNITTSHLKFDLVGKAVSSGRARAITSRTLAFTAASSLIIDSRQHTQSLVRTAKRCFYTAFLRTTP